MNEYTCHYRRCILRRPEVYEELDMEIEIDVEEAENEYIFPDIQDVKEVTSTSIASEITEYHIFDNLPLTNEMIDEALEMIKSENAYLNDSIHMDNLVTEGKQLSWDKRGEKFVAIFSIGGKHYVTISNIFNEMSNCVTIYDSYQSLYYYSKDNRFHYPIFMEVEICKLLCLPTNTSHLVCNVVNLQQVCKSQNASIMSIAYACSLIKNKNPVAMGFNELTLRTEFLHCLQCLAIQFALQISQPQN